MSQEILLRYLPEIYQDPVEHRDLKTLLSVFDEVFFRNQTPEMQGLERIINCIPDLFNCNDTPREFLSWLGQWVSLEYLYDLSDKKKRELIGSIVPLYACRGTKSYLKKILLLLFPESKVTIIDEPLPSMQVGVSRIGIESRLNGDIPFYFLITLQFPIDSEFYTNWQNDHDHMRERMCSVIDLAKPAHTWYELVCNFEEKKD